MKIKFIMGAVIALLINITTSFAQTRNSDANITGHVLDKSNGEHLPFVSIVIKGTTVGTVTNASGHYHITNAPEGSYTIAASFVGYETQEKVITIERRRSVEVNFELKVAAFALDQVVVTANKDEINRKEAVSIVNVVTPKIFESVNSVSLADGLSFQPGLRIENTCQNCGFPQLRINGLEGPYTQILIDSRAINSALAGVYGLEHIPVNMVERVEVVRGGGSALFGSNAVGGVVNIITKEPKYNSLSISNTSNLIYGTTPDISTNLNATIISENNRAGVTLFASARQRDPFDFDEDGFSEIGKIKMKNVGFRGYYRLNSNNRLTLEYHAIDEFRRGGNNFGRPPHESDITEQTDHTIHSGGVKFDTYFKNPNQSMQVYSSLQSIDRQSYYGAGKDPNAYGNTKDLSLVAGSQYTMRMYHLLFMPATLIAGAEYSYNTLKDEMIGYDRVIDQEIGIYSIFAQNEWKNENASVLFGGRMDKHTMIDNPIFSPRISARYAPSSWLNLRASYATGYRGPQAFDEDLHVTAVGQAVALIRLADNLRPEKSNSVNFSVELSKAFSNSAFMFLAEGFYTKLDHVFLLEEAGRDADGNLILERRNGSGAVVAGINLEANVIPIRDFQISAGFTLQSSEYQQPEQWSETVAPQRKMFRSPSNYGYITLTNTIKKLDLSLSGVYTGSMLVQHFAGYVPQDAEIKTPVFFDANFKIAYNFQFRENVTLQLNTGLQNMFDSYQKDFDKGEFRDSGYLYGPTQPRTVFFGIKLSM